MMLVGGPAERAQVAILEDGVLVENYVAKKTRRSLVGNVYLGRSRTSFAGWRPRSSTSVSRATPSCTSVRS